MALGLALRTFWRTLWNRDYAARVAELDRPAPQVEAPAKPQPTPEPKPAKAASPAPGRSEALDLLAALQREARFLDFIQESLAGYGAEDIKAAVLDVHRDCQKVLERMFAIKPLLDSEEGSRVEVPAGFDAARYTLSGNASGSAPYRGTLVHPGWQATKCDVPQWTGKAESSRVLAPAEVEVG
jgi:hypothetical protein